MTESAEPALMLPRPLVNKLLRHTQTAMDGKAWGLISARDNVPANCYPLAQPDSICFNALQHQIEKAGETLFALYGTAELASLQEFTGLLPAGMDVSVLLHVALDTKGVLQLCGWRKTAMQFIELEVGIS